jgi:hypothetical protein
MQSNKEPSPNFDIPYSMLSTFDIHIYDYYLVMFSGGKDSTARFLRLLGIGIPLHKIELWHQLIDGKGLI